MKKMIKKSLALFLSIWMICLIGITAFAAGGEDPNPIITKIKLNHETLSLTYGSTSQLTATVEPAGSDQSVGWQSSNPTLVSVDSYGNLTVAKDTADTPSGKQTVTITCTSMKARNVSATCTVTVDNDLLTKLKAYAQVFVSLFTAMSTALSGPLAQLGSTIFDYIKNLFSGVTTPAE